MRFARWVFLLAGVSGILLIVPHYFAEERIGREFPPAITHPEIYYGFLGVTLAWQALFLVIALDPYRYRLAMLPAILEKASFALAVPVLYAFERVPWETLVLAGMDGTWGVLFVVAFFRTPRQ